jgi:alcohol dehydrogenase (cytochrome c)
MRNLYRRIGTTWVVAALLLPSTTMAQTAPPIRPTHDELSTTVDGGKEWITYGGALNNQRYSTLSQINTSNVGQLRGAWMTRLNSGRGSKFKFEADPLVLDGVMYLPTGNDDVFALDARMGKTLWRWDSDIPQVNDAICCGWVNRGVAAGEGRIYSGNLDGSFVALDQKTGKLLWRTQLEDYHDGYSITGATRYYDGMVFTGMSGGERGVRGRVYALDAKTGSELWRFYTVPGPGEFGSETWPMTDPDPIKRDVYLRGGATVWQAPAIDPELGMMYFSTGNASPQEGSLRPGDSLFTSSILGLDYKTGKYRWHFQEVHHELWDYDTPSPVVLFDQMYNGQMRKGLYQAGKTGWLYFLDRTNGQPLVGIDERPVPQEPRNLTAPTQPYPIGDAFVRQCPEPLEAFPLSGCIFTPYSDVPVLFSPGVFGGSNFNPTSYHPPTGYVFAFGIEMDWSYASNLSAPTQYEPGKSYGRTTSAPALGSPITNTVTAMDSRTNKIVWQKRSPGWYNNGAVSTAGGLMFTGQADGNVVAYDVRTGDQLWKFQTGWGISAAPMTYELDGVQYVVVPAGGHRGGPPIADGDALWVFSLNGTVDEVASPAPIFTKIELSGAPVALGGEVGGATTLGGTWIFQGAFRTFDFRFEPTRVQVSAGTTVAWDNMGSAVHTATDQRGRWDTGDIPAGESRSVTFDTLGSYVFFCKPHPWMIGEVVVQ